MPHDRPDHRAEQPERDEEPAALQDKRDPRTRPDRPTPSDDATLVERDDGAHAEYTSAPQTLSDPPVEEDASADEGDER